MLGRVSNSLPATGKPTMLPELERYIDCHEPDHNKNSNGPQISAKLFSHSHILSLDEFNTKGPQFPTMLICHSPAVLTA